MTTKTLKSAQEFLSDNAGKDLAGAQFKVAAFYVKHTTHTHKHAATDAAFQLIIDPYGSDFIVLNFPDLKKDERERGSTDEYTLQVGKPLFIKDVLAGNIRMRIRHPNEPKDRNAWLPSHMLVTADLVGPDNVVLIDRPWPITQWFSGDQDELIKGIPNAKAKIAWDLTDT